MRTLILLIAAALLPHAALAQWREFVDPAGFFSVNFPAEPEVREIAYDSEYGATLPARIFSVTEGDRLHSLTMVDFSDAQRIYSELPRPYGRGQ